ncbi:MAG: site-2 protease family protein [Planctomycetota bacterium]|nr:site-2 protease family protein [Planctomycetota bacterium]
MNAMNDPAMILAGFEERFTLLTVVMLFSWIFCVCIHEFSHALVAYWGGDRSVREKGYLSLDFTRFIHPVTSLLIPAIVLLVGGFPLPGGAVYIDAASLKSQRWRSAVAAAGPASNFILFLLFCVPIHPSVGLIDPGGGVQPAWVYYCGAMATLNFIATLFNLMPLPPLDGYHIIEHQFDEEMQWKMRQPQAQMIGLVIAFLVFAFVPGVQAVMYEFLATIVDRIGVDYEILRYGFNWFMFNAPMD